MICQLCYIPGHTADRCYQRFDREFKSNFNTNNSTFLANLEWLFDTRMTNHVTNDEENIQNRIEYNGRD